MIFNLKYIFLGLAFLIVFSSCRENEKQERVEHPVLQEKKPEKTLPKKSRLELQFEKAGLVDVCQLDKSIRFDLRYAGKNNFTGIVLYDTLRSIYLPITVAEKLIRAQKILKSRDASLSLIVWDAARPMCVQRKMYARVAGTPLHNYVASPSKTGLHNYGCAVDISICKAKNDQLIDMGTPFDFFGKKAGILHEQQFLTKTQLENRRLLRCVMFEAGFHTVTGEWWHFNACNLSEAKRRYKVLR